MELTALSSVFDSMIYSSEPQKKNHEVKNARLCKGLVFTESNTEKR